MVDVENKQLNDLLDKHCGSRYTTEWEKLNYKLIPVTVIPASIGNEVIFNELYQALLDCGYGQIKRTPSGGISICVQERMNNQLKYDVRQSGTVVEMTICTFNNGFRSYRIQWRINNYKTKNDAEKLISGKQAYQLLKQELAEDDIDLDTYRNSPEEGIEAKKDIHAPDTKVYEGIPDRVYNNAYHLDFHKFYPHGMALEYPAFTPALRRLESKSKADEKYKLVMDAFTGWGRSNGNKNCFAVLLKNSINRAYEDFDYVLEQLQKDREVLFANTDGIWYVGPEWHGPLESPDMGGWSNDHKDCKLRFKSSGCYEFIEDGKYKPVVKGQTKLDKVIARSEWSWGDIYLSKVQVWKFIEGEGITWQDNI